MQESQPQGFEQQRGDLSIPALDYLNHRLVVLVYVQRRMMGQHGIPKIERRKSYGAQTGVGRDDLCLGSRLANAGLALALPGNGETRAWTVRFVGGLSYGNSNKPGTC
jgi:hypothetical protein